MGSQVRDWMTREPITVRVEMSALEAFDQMLEHGIRHLPVLDAQKRLVGILSIDDLRGAFPFELSPRQPLGPVERQEALDYRVWGVMTWAPQTIHPGAPLEEAARSLAEHRIGCLPVVDEEQALIGILSETDALRALDAVLRGAAPPAPGERAADSLVDALWAERERIIEQLSKWQDAERALSADIHDEPRDAADRAEDERGVAGLEPLSERAAGRLRAIDHALERARQGRFGICERCQRKIPPTRLRAIPEATLCMRCARTTANGEA